jgi:hypothetical protein
MTASGAGAAGRIFRSFGIFIIVNVRITVGKRFDSPPGSDRSETLPEPGRNATLEGAIGAVLFIKGLSESLQAQKTKKMKKSCLSFPGVA